MSLKMLLIAAILGTMVPIAARADTTPPPAEKPKPSPEPGKQKPKNNPPKTDDFTPRPVGRAPQDAPMEGTEVTEDPPVKEGKRTKAPSKPKTPVVGTQQQPVGKRAAPEKKKAPAPEFGDPPAK